MPLSSKLEKLPEAQARAREKVENTGLLGSGSDGQEGSAMAKWLKQFFSVKIVRGGSEEGGQATDKTPFRE